MVLTSTKEYASFDQFEALKRLKREGKRGELTRDIWLSKEQAKELGYNQGEEDFLLTPGDIEEGRVFGTLPQPIIEPELPTVQQFPPELTNLIKKIYGGTDVSFTPDT